MTVREIYNSYIMSNKGFRGVGANLNKFRLLRDDDIMSIFSISRTSLHRWKKNGYIPYLKIGSISYYLSEDIQKMLNTLSRNTRRGKDPDDPIDLEDPKDQEAPDNPGHPRG